MAAPKFTAAQRALVKAEVHDRYVRGAYQSEIAAALHLSQGQVSFYLAEIHADWLARHDGDHSAWAAQQLAKLDALEREYWTAWERSCQERTRSRSGQTDLPSTRVDKDGHPIPARRIAAEITKEARDGNPAFLAGVLTCISKRCEILGLNAPTTINHAFITQQAMDVSARTGMPLAQAEAEIRKVLAEAHA
jgi:predicted transcriptional regulator